MKLGIWLVPFLMFFWAAGGPARDVAWKRHVIDGSSRGADGVRLEDVNRDGLPDLVTGWEEGGVTRAYFHPGFADVKNPWPAVTVGSSPSVEDAVFADLDGDGSFDVVSSCEGQTQSVFVHWGPPADSYLDPGAWRTQPLPASVTRMRWMYALPLDADGLHGIDLVIGGKEDHAALGWFESPPDPRRLSDWKWHFLTEVGWVMSIRALDMDGDGDLDLLFSDRRGEQSGCYWLENPGKDQVHKKPWRRHLLGALGKEVMFLVPADLDQDGSLDVVAAVRPRELVFLRRKSSDGLAWEEYSLFLPETAGTAKAVAVGDIDRDGKQDLVFSCEHAEGHRSGVMWLSYRSQPTEPFWQPHPVSGPEGVKFDLVELLDLDGDGDLDILTCEEVDNLGVIWYENPLRENPALGSRPFARVLNFSGHFFPAGNRSSADEDSPRDRP